MHRFAYRNGEFCCEEVPLSHIARRVGTPVYVYSYGTLLDHYRQIQSAFAPVRALICFSVKANGNLALCRSLIRAGAGCDVVSGGELWKALKAGAHPKRIVYSSVGKTSEEIEEAIRAGILFFNAESEQELEAIERACSRLGRRQAISLRLNPEVDPHTHTYITTGHRASKFGIERRAVQALLRHRERFPHLRLTGLHIHIGSQILQAGPFRAALRTALQVVRWARRNGAPIHTLNLGGGMGIIYHREDPQTPAEYARAVLPLLKRAGLKVILEPGRYIVGNAGVLLTRVLYLKEGLPSPAKAGAATEGHSRRFAIVDAGMNDLIRPSLYGAYHAIQPVSPGPMTQDRPRSESPLARGGARLRYDVVGPVCESSDFFARGRRLPRMGPGDLLAILGAGAYGFVMASNYNARPRAPEVLVRGSRMFLVRSRESYSDLVRGERLPAFLR